MSFLYVSSGMFYHQTRTSIGQLYNEYKEGYVDLQPDYQRGFVWSKVQQENLIQSIFENFPIPNIFLIKKGMNFEVFDGKQRLTSIFNFMDNGYFKNLPEPEQRKFRRYGLNVTEIENYTDKGLQTLFERINTGGTAWQYVHPSVRTNPLSNENEGVYKHNETDVLYVVKKIMHITIAEDNIREKITSVIYKPLSNIDGQFYTREYNDFHSKFTRVPDEK